VRRGGDQHGLQQLETCAVQAVTVTASKLLIVEGGGWAMSDLQFNKTLQTLHIAR